MSSQLTVFAMKPAEPADLTGHIDKLQGRSRTILTRAAALICMGLSLTGIALSLPGAAREVWPDPARITEVHVPRSTSANSAPPSTADRSSVAVAAPQDPGMQVSQQETELALSRGEAIFLILIWTSIALLVIRTIGEHVFTLTAIVAALGMLALARALLFEPVYPFGTLTPPARTERLTPEALRYVHAQQIVIASLKRHLPIDAENVELLERTIEDVAQGRILDASAPAVLAIEAATGKPLRTQLARVERELRRERQDVAQRIGKILLFLGASVAGVGVACGAIGTIIKRRVRRIRALLASTAS